MPFIDCSDYATYVNAVNYIKGLECNINPFNRLLTMPLTLLSAVFFSVFTGNLDSGFVILNIIFYFLIIIIFYKLVLEIFNSHKTALISAILFQSNYWLFSYCSAYLADLEGHFFFILTNFFAVKYYLKKNKKYYYYAIMSSVIGVFFKEFGALGMISLGMVILLSNFSWQRKFSELLKAAVLFIFLPGLFHLLFYFKFGYSYFNWYGVNLDSYNTAEMYNIISMIKVLGWVYLAGWPVFLFSLWKIKRYFKLDDYKVALVLLPASLAFFAWPLFMQRTAFVFVPWLAIYTGFGLSKMKNKYIIALILVIYILAGYNMELLLEVINLPF